MENLIFFDFLLGAQDYNIDLPNDKSETYFHQGSRVQVTGNFIINISVPEKFGF